MRTPISAIAVASVLLLSCGNPDTSEMTPEQETVVADTLTMELQNDTQQLKQTTDENLQEVDSLLQNF